MRTFLTTFFVSTTLLGTALLARSDDASPADRAQAILSALPAPGEKDTLKIDMDLYGGGTALGKAMFSATPATVEGTPVWHVEETMELAIGDAKKMSQKTVVTLAADLHLIRLESAESENEKKKATTAVRTEKGFDITKTNDEGTKNTTVEADIHTISSMCSVLIFLRHCPAEPASYALRALSGDKGVIENGTLDVKGPGKFTEGETTVDAFVTHAVLGEHALDIFLDPASRDFIALRGVEGLMLVKTGLLKANEKTMDTSKPAASATEAGARLALAILTSDEALLSSAIDWPSLFANAKGTPDATADEASFKAKIMGQFKTTFLTLSRADASARVATAQSGAKEEVVGDVTVVTFGAPMNAFVYTAKSIEGAWFIVKLTK